MGTIKWQMISHKANRWSWGPPVLGSAGGPPQEACGPTAPRGLQRAPGTPSLSTAVLRKCIRLNHMKVPLRKG